MKKLLAAFMFFAISIPSLALAANFQANGNVPAGETVIGNLYLAGGNPTVNGDVQGDLYVAGGNVIVTGNIADDLVTAGGNISVTGTVEGDLRAFGGSLFIDGVVNGEVIASGGEIKVGPNAQIRKDLVAAGGSVVVDPSARVFGSTMIETDDSEYGEEIREAVKQPFDHFLRLAFWITQVFAVLSSLIIAAVFLGIFPGFVKKWNMRAFSKGQFWPSLGLGFLMLAVTPIAATLLMITGIGAPLGIIIIMLYVAYILLNMGMAGILFGEMLKKWFLHTKKIQPTWAWGLGGVVLLHLVTLVPVVGWMVGFLFFLLSMGAMAATEWKIARSLK